MSSSSSVTIHLSLALHFLLSLSVCTSATETAYEILEDYDFPVGLLPSGVTGYEINSTTGAFEAYLNDTCTFSLDSYELKYKSTISGYIATDKLTSLAGIYVKVWLFWLKIEEVTRDGDELEFSVGIATAEFPTSNFDESPTCGCGFDCDSLDDYLNFQMTSKNKLRKMRLKNLVSSS